MKSEQIDFDAVVPVWVAVANVVLEREFGEEHEIRNGTKHFRGGTKVYLRCRANSENIEVVGRHRVSGRWITVIMRPQHLANGRAELLYSTAVLARLADYNWRFTSFDGSDQARKTAEDLAKMARGIQPFVVREKSTDAEPS